MNINTIKNWFTKLKKVNPYLVVIYSGAVFYLTYSLIKRIRNKLKFRKLKAIAVELIIERNLKIDAFVSKYKNSVDEELQRKILKLTASQLAKEIREGNIKSKDAFITYSLRCATIGKKLNLIADVDFDSGLLLAKKADLLVSNTKKEDINNLPPFLGVPFSIKDNYLVKGMISSLGLIALNEKSQTNSYTVDTLLELGAVPLVKSNVPQGLLALETSNRLYGEALNPWNLEKTPGGSSGGESGLISCKCSPIGIGGDIGGSIRNPANYCGIYGFKPSINRISSKNQAKVNSFPIIVPSNGPITFDLNDTIYFCKSIFGKFSNDYFANSNKFNENIFSEYSNKNKKLKLGYSYKYSRVEVAPGITKEFENLLQKLKQEGYELVEVDWNQFCPLIDAGITMIFNSGRFQRMLELGKGEPFMPFYKSISLANSISDFTKNIVCLIYGLIGETRKRDTLLRLKKYDLFELFKNNLIFEALKEEFYSKYRELGIDGLILPVQPTPAIDLSINEMTPYIVYYTMLLNILDMPAGSIPLGLLKDNSYNSVYNDSIFINIKNSVKRSMDMPIGIQIATLPCEDEKCLAIMKRIDDLTKEKKNAEYKDLFESGRYKTKKNVIDSFKDFY